jgi:hypothetical protein
MNFIWLVIFWLGKSFKGISVLLFILTLTHITRQCWIFLSWNYTVGQIIDIEHRTTQNARNFLFKMAHDRLIIRIINEQGQSVQFSNYQCKISDSKNIGHNLIVYLNNKGKRVISCLQIWYQPCILFILTLVCYFIGKSVSHFAMRKTCLI